MECAGELCEEWVDVGCFGHTLQLAIKPAFELPCVIKVISKARKLVGHFRHSTTLTAELRKRQETLGIPNHDLVQDVATRWNSTHDMLERLVEQRRALTDILLDTSVSKKSDAQLLLSDNEWETASDLVSVLSHLTETTAYMSTESHVSISEVYPIVCGLVSGPLKQDNDDSELISRVKELLSRDLCRRFQPESDETARSVSVLGSLLDIRYKDLNFLGSEKRKCAEETLEARLDDVPFKVTVREDSVEPSPKRRKLAFLTSSKSNPGMDELPRYLSEPVDEDINPLEWWKRNEVRFPRIAQVARSVLAIPATSVPSERIFSAAGLIVTKLRNRISTDLVDKIIFLRKNDKD